jgi:predicted O-methyltransferase YrrM
VPGGKLYTLELDPKRAEIARGHFGRHGLSETIEVIEGRALETLKALDHLKEIDFVFLDADKSNYGEYARWAIPRLKKGGLLLADNAYIWGGMNYFGRSVEEVEIPPKGRLDSFSKNDFTGMSDCWQQMMTHPELASIILPTGEGLGIAIKK